jgi:hypothetical protein
MKGTKGKENGREQPRLKKQNQIQMFSQFIKTSSFRQVRRPEHGLGIRLVVLLAVIMMRWLCLKKREVLHAQETHEIFISELTRYVKSALNTPVGVGAEMMKQSWGWAHGICPTILPVYA